ncbi:MAG: hypothetical protein H6659_05880 [Ardenticatenaceae bacterium]|nr:hypothetical protein [Ardenticatenaceae bacterium]
MSGYQKATAVLGMLLLFLVIGALARQERQPEVVQLTPTLTGQPELCLTCHEGIEEISPTHSIETFGCVLCHGGDGLALDKDLAHATMRGGRNPSDLVVVEESCGGSACHSGAAADGRDHIHRVLTSVQATYAGAIAQVNYAFGGQADTTAHFGVTAVEDDEITTYTGLPALAAFHPGPEAPDPVQTFNRDCMHCHLSAAATQEPYYYRATGCAACHVVYENDGLYRGGDPTTPKDEPGHGRTHQLTTAIPYYQCNHCHNRGNYSLRQMTFLEREDLPGSPYLSAQDQRELEYYQPISQFTLCEWELDCVDCHTNGEVMGNGDIHSNQQEIQYIQCRTCHGTLTEMPLLETITDPDHPAIYSADLNPNYSVAVGDTVIATTEGETFGWVQWDGERLVETGKVDGRLYEVPLVMGSSCQQNPDEQESAYCHECHTYERTVTQP